MVSRKRDLAIYGEELQGPLKRNKQEDQSQSKVRNTLFNERPNSENMRSITFDFELHLHSPLPSDWQKCLEAKDYSRKSGDHWTYPKDSEGVMSLDLELNLSSSDSPSKTKTNKDEFSNHNETVSSKGKNSTNSNKKSSIVERGFSRSPSWLAFQGDDDVKEQEMVTTVCKKCHMLVMLCTSTPVCPNCKFIHPHDHSSTKLFQPSNLLRLLC